MTDRDPSALIVPFGKHRGATVAELVAKDPQYVDWLQGQGWLVQRFAELHAALASRGAGTDDTPEHNALQARFLDEGFRLALLRLTVGSMLKRDAKEKREDCGREQGQRTKGAIKRVEDVERRWFHRHERGGKSEEERDETEAAWTAVRDKDLVDAKYEACRLQREEDEFRATAAIDAVSKVRFEYAGVDVIVKWDFTVNGDPETAWRYSRDEQHINAELKPAFGDDFPSIMRQMERLKATVLVAYEYNGRGASELQMRAMLKASGIQVVFVHEIEAEMQRANQ